MSPATPQRGQAQIVKVMVGVATIWAQSRQAAGYVSKATPTVSRSFPATTVPVAESSL